MQLDILTHVTAWAADVDAAMRQQRSCSRRPRAARQLAACLLSNPTNPTSKGSDVRSRVSYGKPMRVGEFLPQPLAACGQAGGSPVSGATSAPGESTSTGGHQQGGGGSSASSGGGGGRDGANSGGGGFSGCRASAGCSAPRSGGDDSDDGDDDDGGGKRRLQPIGKAHSLESPYRSLARSDSAAAPSPSTGASTPAGAIAPASSISESSCSAHAGVSGSEGTHSNTSSSEGNASEQPSQPALAAAAAAAGARDRARSWHALQSPFAAAAADAAEACVHASTVLPAAQPAPAAPAGPPAASAAGSGPWRLHSPFAAAPLPAFSDADTQLNDAAAAAAATGSSSAGNGGSGATIISSKAAAGKQQVQAAPHTGAPMQPASSKLHSQLAMAQPPGRAAPGGAPRGGGSSSSAATPTTGTGSSRARPLQLPTPPPHPASSPAVKQATGSSNMLKERMAVQQHKAAVTASRPALAQPLRLHSPFAAAAAALNAQPPGAEPASSRRLAEAAAAGDNSGALTHEPTISSSGISSLPAAEASNGLSAVATGLPPPSERGAWSSKVPLRHSTLGSSSATTTATAGSLSAAAGCAPPFAAVQQTPHQAASPACCAAASMADRPPLPAPTAAAPRPGDKARHPTPATSAPASPAPEPAVVSTAAGEAAWEGHVACALPPAVTEGVPTPQLDVLVVRPAPVAGVVAGGAPGYSLRVVAHIEGIAVGRTREVPAASGEHVLRLALPPLPRGVLQLSINWRGKLHPVAAVPILPPACAAEMGGLWADTLQQQQQQPATAGESSVSSAQLAAASERYQAVVGSVGDILALQPLPGLPAEAEGKAAGSACPSGPAAAAAMAAATLSAAAAGPVPVAPAHHKAQFAQLVHLFAEHDMWAVMQLATDCCYGAGASARALYACKHTAGLGASAQASAAAPSSC